MEKKKQARKPRAKKEVAVVPKKKLEISPEILSNIALKGDISGLNPEQQVQYYFYMCDKFELDPSTKPFDMIAFKDGRKQLYANKNCAEQLRERRGISVVSIEQNQKADFYEVKVSVSDKTGRTDGDIGMVSLRNAKGEMLTGESLANKIMAAVTKAKRRATYSICGLGMLDETEVDTIPNATTTQGSVFVNGQKEDLNVNMLFDECKSKMSSSKTSVELARIKMEYSGLDYNQEQRDELTAIYDIRKRELIEAEKEKLNVQR